MLMWHTGINSMCCLWPEDVSTQLVSPDSSMMPGHQKALLNEPWYLVLNFKILWSSYSSWPVGKKRGVGGVR